MKLVVRPARFDDYPKLCSFDEFLGDRRIDMQKGELYVCDCPDEQAVGYLKLSTEHFFDWPMVVILCVKESSRRMGVGSKLLRFASQFEHLPRLYVSTEASNDPMRKLLADEGASEIGYIDLLNLDEERELLYRLK